MENLINGLIFYGGLIFGAVFMFMLLGFPKVFFWCFSKKYLDELNEFYKNKNNKK